MEITSVRRSLSIRRMNGPDRCFPLCRAIIEKYRERESSLFSCPIQRERFTKRLMEWRQHFANKFPKRLWISELIGKYYRGSLFFSSCNEAGKREAERNKKVNEPARAHDKRCDINAVSR